MRSLRADVGGDAAAGMEQGLVGDHVLVDEPLRKGRIAVIEDVWAG